MKSHLQKSYLELSDWQLIRFSGPDTESFLHGQLTNNVKSLKEGHGQLQCRLNRSGQLLGFGYLYENNKDFFWLVPTSLCRNLKEDLDKYIIMEEVEVSVIDSTPVLLLGAQWACTARENKLSFIPFYGEFAFMSALGTDVSSLVTDVEEIEYDQLLKSSIVSGGNADIWNSNDVGALINNSFLNTAVDYDKGCFLGQETAAKIHHRRGAAKSPVLLKIEDSNLPTKLPLDLSFDGKKVGTLVAATELESEGFGFAYLPREFRVHGRDVAFSLDSGELKCKVLNLPLVSRTTDHQRAVELYENAVEKFHEGDDELALSLLSSSLYFDESYSDSYETIGVILGRKEQYEEAIEWMDKLSKVNPDSVMAHTNRSLYLMKLGKIEEAEEEKNQATLKTFQSLGKEAEQKREIERQAEAEKQDLLRKKEMFAQVLEIDSDDELANYGMGDVLLRQGSYLESRPYLEKVLSINEKYSVAYLALGKCLEALGEQKEASVIYEKGIHIASANGDMMPANEMQSRLSRL
jgi:folate-binding Fe-S cluster repair protein YgfZ/Tfp pilus assembly protein PilF